MKLPEEIPKGEYGWRNRKLEICILEVFERSTVPHDKYRMWQKLQRVVTASNDRIYDAMARLELQDYLIHTGHDDDGESQFTIKN